MADTAAHCTDRCSSPMDLDSICMGLSALPKSTAVELKRVCALQDPEAAKQLGERWQDAIMDLCDDELLFAQAWC